MALLRPTAPQPRVWLILDGARDTERASGALALAARSMDPDELHHLDAALAELGRRLDLRANPLADDFDDEEPEAQLRTLLPAALPKLTAARALLSPAWRGSAGGFAVHAATSCPTGARCIDPWARGGSDDERRARFLAWPISGAAILQFPDAATATRSIERLRRRAAARESRIALVIDLAQPDAIALASLNGHARQVAHRLRQADRDPLLAELLEDVSAPHLPSWLPVAPDRVLVVPRLGGVADLTPFVHEIATTAPDADWLVRPRPLD